MLLTYSRLAEVVEEELGRDPAKSSFEALINEAGEAWVNAASWRYLRDRSLDIAVTAGVEEYRLGKGVRAATHLHRPDSHWGDIPIVSFQAWEANRSRYLARIEQSHTPVATTRHNTREDDRAPRLYLSLFPVDFTERVTVQYHAGWLPLDKQNEVADIPVPLAVAFLHWLRLYANAREFPEQHPMGSLDRFRQSHIFRAARTADGESSGPIVKAAGGAGARYARAESRKRGGGVWTRSELLRWLPGRE